MKPVAVVPEPEPEPPEAETPEVEVYDLIDTSVIAAAVSQILCSFLSRDHHDVKPSLLWPECLLVFFMKDHLSGEPMIQVHFKLVS